MLDAGFTAVLTNDRPRQGELCAVVLPSPRPHAPGLFGNLMQSVDAKPLRNQRLRFTAAVRTHTSAPDAAARLWLRVDRANGIMGAFDNMADRPIRNADWQDYSITAEIDDDADRLSLGLMASGDATAWIDDVRFDLLGEVQTPKQPARPVTSAGLTNLIALTRLLGYVQYFHPSDEAASNHWESFAIQAVDLVEPATNTLDLAARLQRTFAPVAPTLRVYPTGQEPPLPLELVPPQDTKSLRVRSWEHHGLGSRDATHWPNIYYSLRLNLTAAEAAQRPSPTEPKAVFRAELAGGVSCLLPLALYADEHCTLPRASGPSHTETNHSALRYTVGHRAARLATVALLWNVFQHFYPYSDVVQTVWSEELVPALQAAAVASDEAAFYHALNRLVVALHDGHGNLIGPGRSLNVPLPVACRILDQRLVILNTASNVVGLSRGDIVETVQGRPVNDTLTELRDQFSAATPQWRDLRALLGLGGPLGATVRLGILDSGGSRRTVEVRPEPQPPPPLEQRPMVVAELQPDLFYVDLTRLTDAEWKTALPRLSTARGIVFDLRGYPRMGNHWLQHLSKEPLQSAYWIVPIVRRPDRQSVEWSEQDRWLLTAQDPTLTTNRVFLANAGVISYAESLLGIVEAYRLGDIVGEPTAGTNGNINQTSLPLGYRVIWTGMKVLKHDRSQHHGVGIQPTIPVTPTLAGIRAGRDEVLDKGLETVQKRLQESGR